MEFLDVGGEAMLILVGIVEINLYTYQFEAIEQVRCAHKTVSLILSAALISSILKSDY